jgi:hypothetical protein
MRPLHRPGAWHLQPSHAVFVPLRTGLKGLVGLPWAVLALADPWLTLEYPDVYSGLPASCRCGWSYLRRALLGTSWLIAWSMIEINSYTNQSRFRDQDRDTDSWDGPGCDPSNKTTRKGQFDTMSKGHAVWACCILE